MSPAKKATSGRSGAASKVTKTTAKRSTGKKTAAKKTPAKRTAAKKTPARAVPKQVAKKTPARSTAPKTVGKKTTAKKVAAKKVAAKKTPAKAPAKKQVARKTTAKAPVAGTAKRKPPVTKPVTRPAPTAPPKKRVRPAKFTPDQLKKIKNGLVAKKVELEARQRELEETSFVGTQSDISGEIGIDEDFSDSGTATFERERDLSIRNNIRDLIDQVTRAIERIEERTYGTCERCGQPIDATRLRELSHASLCLDCKRREERAR